MGEIIVGSVAVAAILGIVAFWGIYATRRTPLIVHEKTIEDRTNRNPAPAPGNTANGNGAPNNNDAATIEQSKLVIHALLRSVSESIESLLGDSTRYGNALDRHRSAIGKAMTIAGIEELERVMLAELEEMRRTNSAYQKQLDAANVRLAVQQEELEKLQVDAGTDFLTKVPNRRSFDTRIAEEVARANRYGTGFALVILDIDHFKDVNDIYGHVAGDRVLRAIAQVIDEEKRASDFLARYGGEEFALILPETNAAQAGVLAHKIRDKVARAKFRFEEKSVWVTLSAGVGHLMLHEDTAESLFMRTDGALQRAKQCGRNNVEIVKGPAQTALPESR